MRLLSSAFSCRDMSGDDEPRAGHGQAMSGAAGGQADRFDPAGPAQRMKRVTRGSMRR
jgi:hypothetical protein